MAQVHLARRTRRDPTTPAQLATIPAQADSVAERRLLAALWHFHEATAREIAAYVGALRGATTRYLRELEARGYALEFSRPSAKRKGLAGMSR